MRIRHLITRGAGPLPRFYWQPTAALRAAGFIPQRLPDDAAAAAARAEELNRDVDAWRHGGIPADAPPAVHRRAAAERRVRGTVGALIQEYQASRFWTALAPSTRREYQWALDLIDAWAGDVLARAITSKAVEAFYQANRQRVEGSGRARRVVLTPAKGAAAVRVLRLLLAHGERWDYLPKGGNPATRPGISAPRQREPVLWSPAQVAHMAAAADHMGWRSIGTAIVLNEWLGQREADVLGLPLWQVEQGALVLRQGKTGRCVSLPVQLVPHLVARLQGEAARPGGVQGLGLLLVNERTGKRWNEHTFRHEFQAVRNLAVAGWVGVAGDASCAALRFMELRHSAVTRLHEARVDVLGIAAITGHTEGSVAAMLKKHYLIFTARAAERAFKARLESEAEGGA